MPRARGGIERSDIAFALNDPVTDDRQHALLAIARNTDVDRTIIEDTIAVSIQKPLTGAWPENTDPGCSLLVGTIKDSRTVFVSAHGESIAAWSTPTSESGVGRGSSVQLDSDAAIVSLRAAVSAVNALVGASDSSAPRACFSDGERVGGDSLLVKDSRACFVGGHAESIATGSTPTGESGAFGRCSIERNRSTARIRLGAVATAIDPSDIAARHGTTAGACFGDGESVSCSRLEVKGSRAVFAGGHAESIATRSTPPGESGAFGRCSTERNRSTARIRLGAVATAIDAYGRAGHGTTAGALFGDGESGRCN